MNQEAEDPARGKDGKDIANWDELKTEIDRIRVQYKPSDIKPLLFRGLADAQWNLSTTLERYAPNTKYSLDHYHRIICQIQPQVETVTEKNWNHMQPDEFSKWLHADHFPVFHRPLPGYEYMIYLRHHGFPSPLLDWTSSLEIATYFAFNPVPKGVEKVSIFAYKEYGDIGKMYEGGDASISGWGHNIKSHKRHFLQKSQYTICTKAEYDQMNALKSVFYTLHDEVFAQESKVIEQDSLWKFNLPVRERAQVLRMLENVNINAFSLFGTEEGLMNTFAVKKFVMVEKP